MEAGRKQSLLLRAEWASMTQKEGPDTVITLWGHQFKCLEIALHEQFNARHYTKSACRRKSNDRGNGASVRLEAA